MADFGGIHNVVMHSAATLQDDEVMIGLFAPLGYGLNEDLSIFLHPILELLMTPNIYLRYRYLSLPKLDLSVQAGYMQSLLDTSRIKIPATGHIMMLTTWYPLEQWSFSVHTGYIFYLNPVDHGMQFGVDANWLITESDMLTFSVSDQWFRYGSIKIPYGMVVYTHTFELVRISIGAAFSKLPFQTGTISVKYLPVIPIFNNLLVIYLHPPPKINDGKYRQIFNRYCSGLKR